MRSAYGLDAGPDTNWRMAANCNLDNAELFFINEHVGRVGLSRANREALKLCYTCPVIAQCYLDARDHPAEGWRIAGGQVWRSATRRELHEGAVARRLTEIGGVR